MSDPDRSTDFCHRSRRTQEDFRTRHLGPSNPAWADLAWSPSLSTLSEPHTSSWGTRVGISEYRRKIFIANAVIARPDKRNGLDGQL